METAVAVINDFNLNLLQSYRQTDSDGNLIFSSFSIMVALMMLYEGMKGNTKTQIEKVLNLKKSNDLITEEFHSLFDTIRGLSGDSVLNIANMLMVDKHFEILPKFIHTLKTSYYSEIKQLDFVSNPEDARVDINCLIELATMQKIKDFFPTGSIDSTTKLVLANAIYFKGKWSLQFDKSKTRKIPFYTLSNEEKLVDMMYREGEYNYTYLKEMKTSFLELPYLGDELSMVIILPDDRDGLTTLENQISTAVLNKAIEKMHVKFGVHLSLPKFKLEKRLELKEILMGMGIEDVFSSAADLSGITGAKTLLVSSVLHQTFVEMDVEGTEAAAATGVEGIFLSDAPHIPFTFIVDHPFMFLIRERATGLMLFTGSVYEL